MISQVGFFSSPHRIYRCSTRASPFIRLHSTLNPKFAFRPLGLGTDILKFCSDQGFEQPTHIQHLAVPHILKEKDVIFADQTGSGKTLAYLLPTAHKIGRIQKTTGAITSLNRPDVLILVPSQELAQQVLSVTRKLRNSLKTVQLNCISLIANNSFHEERQKLEFCPQVVIGTPGRVLRHLKSGSLHLSNLHTVVIDEADVLFDEGFVGELRDILKHPKRRSENLKKALNGQAQQLIAKDDLNEFRNVQFILTSATVNEPNLRFFRREFPRLEVIISETHHQTVASLKANFVTVKGKDKFPDLINVLKQSMKDSGNQPKTLIFCNTIDSCRATSFHVEANGIECTVVHKKVPDKERQANWFRFVNDEVSILITTDAACRGLDLPIDHVILFDFPRNTTEYIHRVGRTARNGMSGKVTALVKKKDMALSRAIQEAQSSHKTLEGLSRERNAYRTHMSKKWSKAQKKKMAEQTDSLKFMDHTILDYQKPVINNVEQIEKQKFNKQVKSKGITNTNSGVKWFYPGNGQPRVARWLTTKNKKNMKNLVRGRKKQSSRST